ncbi:transcriptional regulator [Mesorhizobium albiziae]|nr:transcriptional regulator [Mesorhizobium albiziae]
MFRCTVAGVEAVEAETRHVFARHTHDQFGIGVIHRGAQKSLSGRGMVEAGPGDVITVNPGEVHDGAPIGDSGRAWKMLYFDPVLVAEAASDIRQGRMGTAEFSFPVIHDADVALRFRKLFATLTAGDNTFSCDEELLMLLAAVIGKVGSTDRLMPPAVSRAKSRIDDDPAAPVALADLARESGTSRFQLLRAFARVTGLTPHAYLVQRRVDTARRLIASGTPLALAAAGSGFADQSHMTRVFISKYGVSPGVYAAAMN